jgi:Caspase domain
MRKALIVGIDYYSHLLPLKGCVKDANAVANVLGRNADGTINFATPRVLVATDAHSPIDRRALRDAVETLFRDDPEIALLYFAGHGFLDETGGFLCASDSRDGDDGLALSDVMTFARGSEAANKIIILDSCHSGIAGNRPGGGAIAEITQGVTLLTASTEDQYSYEGGNGAPGVFTNLLVDALHGAAANLVGDVTPGSVYAHIDQSLGPWGGQRPVFKTNVKSFVSLRKAAPPIALEELLLLATYFPEPGFKFQLEPSFEPERSQEQRDNPDIPQPDPAKNAIFRVLQNYVKVNLVRPLDAPHMWHPRPGDTPIDRYLNAVGTLAAAMDRLAGAFDELGKVLGDDGRQMVDVKGVDTRDCIAWRELIGRIDEELVVWSRVYRRVNGVEAGRRGPVPLPADDEFDAQEPREASLVAD